MKTCDYLVAENLDACLEEYAKGKAVLKANGLDLLDLMKERVQTPEAVLSMGGVKELAYIKEGAGGSVRIGCMTTLADMERSGLLEKKFRALHEAAKGTGTPQVRERATLAGNLCQRPRCWYFRNLDVKCLKKTGNLCYAVQGENPYHAIIEGGPCYIVHPSNVAPALLALDAEFKLRTKDAERTVKAEDFFVLPSDSLYKENVLQKGEIIEEIVLPRAPEQSATVEIREKQTFDWPLALASVARAGGQWRVCLGAAAPVPWRCRSAEDVLGSKDMTEELAAQAAETVAEEADPLSQNAAKVQQAQTAVKRALLVAAGLETPK